MEKKYDKKEILKYAGAFIAWMIGSGFATGQEILRFFSSYGYLSYGVIFINFIGFIFIGRTLLITGYEHREEIGFSHFEYYCGKKIGKFYFWLTPIILFCMMSVLFSAAGSTLSQYYCINHYVGAVLMASLVLGIYLIGFDEFVQVVSKIGPVVIVFCLSVGIVSVFNDFNKFSKVPVYINELSKTKISPNWILGAVLYMSLNFITGSTYYTNLGITARKLTSVKWGATIGATVIVIAIAIINTGILLNGENLVSLSIPTLYLAKKINYIFGGIFSIVLILGMFSSCAATMWSICSCFFTKDKRKNNIFAVIITVLGLFIGLLPFSSLVSLIFPLIGYYGLFYFLCILYKTITKKSIFSKSIEIEKIK